jgi:hypothetical protein
MYHQIRRYGHDRPRYEHSVQFGKYKIEHAPTASCPNRTGSSAIPNPDDWPSAKEFFKNFDKYCHITTERPRPVTSDIGTKYDSPPIEILTKRRRFPLELCWCLTSRRPNGRGRPMKPRRSLKRKSINGTTVRGSIIDERHYQCWKQMIPPLAVITRSMSKKLCNCEHCREDFDSVEDDVSDPYEVTVYKRKIRNSIKPKWMKPPQKKGRRSHWSIYDEIFAEQKSYLESLTDL